VTTWRWLWCSVITQYVVFYCVTAIVRVCRHTHGMVLMCREKIMFFGTLATNTY